mgnify:FL=1
MDKNKRIVLIVGIIVLILSIIGGTYAVFKWRSTDEQKTTITFAAEAGFSCSADGGGNINVGDKKLIPTYVNAESINNYIKQEIKATATITKDNITVYMDLWLDVKSISTQLANSDNFKYALTTSSTSNIEGVVVSGTFKNGIVDNKVMLLNGEVYTTTKTNTYYLWIWVDPAETGMMEQEFSLSLNGSCTDKPLPYSEDILNGGYPRLDDGMIPVVFDTTNGTVIKTVSNTDSSWYSYNNKEWANVVLVNETSRSKYLNTTGVTVSESDILAYYVWIPRYKYKIWTTGTSAKGQEQEIEIVFEDKTTSKSLGTAVGEYRTHPAFTFGTTELNGIWVGKFETTGTSSTPTVKPDVSSLRNQNVSTQFATAQKLGGTTYGVSSNVDSHMMKNSEWGAVAYLSHSKYGVNRELYINNSSSYYTGRSGGNVGGSTAINTVYPDQTSTTQYNNYGFYTWDGFLLNYNTNTKSNTRDLTKVGSTTGNITGVYDMSGGAYEYVMGVFANSDGQLWSGYSTSSNSGFTGLVGSSGTSYTGTTFPDSKYYDVYKASSGTTISALTACNGEICYGHGLSEVKNWYGDLASFVSAGNPWFRRGGYYYNGADAGAFYFNSNTGNASNSSGFRSVLSFVGA